MKKTIILNGHEVSYDLQRKRVKNINLRIKADMSVSVSASSAVPIKVIEEFMQSKADYILKALDHYAARAENAPTPLLYTDDDTLSVLGKELELRVVQGNKNAVEIDGEYIVLTVTNTADTELKKRVLALWLDKQCQEIVRSVCEAVYPFYQQYNIAFPQLRFKHMKSRWGSCQPSTGVLTFNLALIHTPIECVEYVVAHEFTHFLQPNHSKKFYQQLALFMPDWGNRKERLKQYNSYCNNI